MSVCVPLRLCACRVCTYIKVTQFSCCLSTRAGRPFKTRPFIPNPSRSSTDLWHGRKLNGRLIQPNETWASWCSRKLPHASGDWVNWSWRHTDIQLDSNPCASQSFILCGWKLISLITFLLGTKSLFRSCYLTWAACCSVGRRSWQSASVPVLSVIRYRLGVLVLGT